MKAFLDKTNIVNRGVTEGTVGRKGRVSSSGLKKAEREPDASDSSV